MKKIIIIAIGICIGIDNLNAQYPSKIKVKKEGVIITNSGDPDSDESVVLDVHSQNKGVVFPRLTAEQKEQISNPTIGLLIYNLTSNYYEYWNGSKWLHMGFSTVIETPAAPTNLTYSVVSSSQIHLSWVDNSDNETGFEVWRKTGAAGTYDLISTTAADVTSYQDTRPMLIGDEYFYKIRASNVTLYSTYTSELSIHLDFQTIALTANHNWTARGDQSTNFEFSSGNSVSQWNDLGIENKNLTQTTLSKQPTLYASGEYSINGRSATYYSNKLVEGTSAVDWKFLHDGTTDYTIVSAFTHMYASNFALLLTTVSYPGYGIRGFFSDGRFYFGHLQNSTDKWLASIDCLNDELNVIIIRFNSSMKTLTLNIVNASGSNVVSVSANSFYGSNPEHPLQIGRDTYLSPIEVSEMQIWKSYKSDEWVNSVENWLYDYYKAPDSPVAPTGLTGIVASSSQINLSWTDNSNNEANFTIERKTGAEGTWREIATVTADVTTYSDDDGGSGLIPNTEYYYQIKSMNAGGESAYSSPINATTYFEIDAQAFIDAAGIIEPSQQSAINTLVTDLKTHGLWTKMKAIYPFVGGTEATHKWNLKDPRDLDEAFRLTFAGGWVHSGTGGKPDGTTGKADTYLIPSTNLSINNTHLSYYSRTDDPADNSNEIAATISVYSSRLSMELNYENAGFASDAYNFYSGQGRITTSNVNTTGYYIASRTATNSHRAFKNGGLLVSGTSSGGTFPNVSIYLGANNNNGGGGSAFSKKECAFASIGSGLTDTDCVNLNTLIQAFQTTLGRQIDPTTLGAPSNLTASVASSSQIDLSWADNSDNETGFEVWRKSDAGGSYALINTTTADATSYQDTPPMLAGDVYFYQIRATEGTYTSAYTSEVSAVIDYDAVTSEAFVNYTARGARTDNFEFSSGDYVSKWKDQSVNGIDLIQNTSSYQPRLYETGTNSINENPGLKSDGSVGDHLAANNKSDFNFLHDGTTPYTIVMVFKPFGTSGNLADICGVINTSHYSYGGTVNTGFRMFFIGATNENPNKVSGGIYAGGVMIGGFGSAPNTIQQQGLNIVIFRFENSNYYLDIKNSSISSSAERLGVIGHSSGNSDMTFRTHTLNNPNVDAISISEIQIIKESKSDEWVNATLDWLYNYYTQ